jgi:hypothetical protein
MSADSNISTPVVRIGEPRHHHLPGARDERLAARAARRDVVQAIGQLEAAQRLARDPAERRRLERVELEQLLGRARAAVAAAAAEPPQPETIDDASVSRPAPSSSGTRRRRTQRTDTATMSLDSYIALPVFGSTRYGNSSRRPARARAGGRSGRPSDTGRLIASRSRIESASRTLRQNGTRLELVELEGTLRAAAERADLQPLPRRPIVVKSEVATSRGRIMSRRLE